MNIIIHYIVVCGSYQITRLYTTKHKTNETNRSQWMKSNTFWCRRMFLLGNGSWNEEMNGTELHNHNKLKVHLNENYIKNKCITKCVCVWPLRHQFTSASTVNWTPCSLSTFQTSTNQHSPPFRSAQYILMIRNYDLWAKYFIKCNLRNNTVVHIWWNRWKCSQKKSGLLVDSLIGHEGIIIPVIFMAISGLFQQPLISINKCGIGFHCVRSQPQATRCDQCTWQPVTNKACYRLN